MHPPVNDTLALEGHSGVHPVLLNHTDITDKSANRSLQQRGDVKIFRANRLNSSDTSVSPQGHLTSNGTKPNTSTGIKFHNDTESDKKFVKLRITTTNDHNNRSEFWLNDNFTLFGFDQNDTTAFLLNRTQGDMSQPQVSENSGVQHWAVHLAIGVAAGTTCLVLFLGLLLYLYKHKQKGVGSSSGDSHTKSYQETRWDDISLHWIEPRDFRKDSYDDLASMDNDSYLNSLDQLMFQKVWKTNEPIGQINTVDRTGLAITTKSLPADRSGPSVI